MSIDLEAKLRKIVKDGTLTHLSIAALPRGKSVIWSVSVRDTETPGIILREDPDFFTALEQALKPVRRRTLDEVEPVAPPKRRNVLEDL